MPKPVSPDRPIWPPLPAETDGQPESDVGAAERAPADGAASEPAGGLAGPGTRPDPAGPVMSAVLA